MVVEGSKKILKSKAHAQQEMPGPVGVNVWHMTRKLMKVGRLKLVADSMFSGRASLSCIEFIS